MWWLRNNLQPGGQTQPPRRTHRSLGHNEFTTGTLATYLEFRRPIAGEPKEAAHD